MKQKYIIITRIFICCLILFTLLISLQGCKKPKVYTIGIIDIIPTLDEIIPGFKEGMKEFGYIEGENLKYSYFGLNTDISKPDIMAHDLLKSNVDLIITVGTPATKAAQKATTGTGIPVVFVSVTDPVKAGIVHSLKYPGGNITGVSFGIGEARRLEWLLRIAPKTSHIYAPYNPGDRSPVLALKTLKETAERHSINIISRKVHNNKELDHAIKNIPENANAVFLLPDSLFSPRLDDFINHAIKRKIPVSGANIEIVKKRNALTSFGFSQFSMGKQAARLADLIFHGMKPAGLPVEIAEFYLAINLKVAEKIGLTINDEILRQADIIIR